MNQFAPHWDLIRTVWPAALIGSILFVAAIPVGFALARSNRFPPVKWIDWWVAHVAWPIVESRHWSHRFLGILVNNTAVLVVIVFLGRWRWLSLLAIVSTGASLGIGLRLLAARSLPNQVGPQPTKPSPLIMRVGVILNLLEPPAIALAIGLSLTRSTPSALGAPDQLWNAFAAAVMPLLVLAAAGEALWLGAVRGGPRP